MKGCGCEGARQQVRECACVYRCARECAHVCFAYKQMCTGTCSADCGNRHLTNVHIRRLRKQTLNKCAQGPVHIRRLRMQTAETDTHQNTQERASFCIREHMDRGHTCIPCESVGVCSVERRRLHLVIQWVCVLWRGGDLDSGEGWRRRGRQVR